MTRIKKTSILLYISAVMLFVLACGVSQGKSDVFTNTYSLPEVSTDVISMTVTAERLYVRDAPNGNKLPFYLLGGDMVIVYAERTRGDINWCKITPAEPERWVGCGWLEAK